MNTNEVELAMLELSESQKYEVEREWKKHFTAEKEKIKHEKTWKEKNKEFTKNDWIVGIASVFFIISLIISFVVCCFYQSAIFEKFEKNAILILAGIFLFPGIFLILLSVFDIDVTSVVDIDVSKENINFYNEYKQEFMLKKIEEIKRNGTASNDSEEMLLIIKLSREKEEKIIKKKIRRIKEKDALKVAFFCISLFFTLSMLFLPIFEMSDLLCLVGFEKNETLYNLLTKKIFTDGKDTFFEALLFEYEQGSFSYIICKIFPYMINIIVYLEALGLLIYGIQEGFGNIANKDKEEIFEIENLEIENLEINAVGSLFSVAKMFGILLIGLINLIMCCPILLLLLLENQIYFELSTWGIIFCVMSSLAGVCKVTTYDS